MRELLELQTGQVAFISGLMSGFSLSIAAHVLRYGIRSRMAQMVFLLFLLSVGVCSSMMAGVALGTLWFIWQDINVISATLEKLQ